MVQLQIHLLPQHWTALRISYTAQATDIEPWSGQRFLQKPKSDKTSIMVILLMRCMVSPLMPPQISFR